jgi:ABC-type antimicrobial peptide transport system permease subunit
MNFTKKIRTILTITAIAITALIVVLLLTALRRPKPATPDSNRLSDIRTFQAALELYMKDRKDYPDQLNDLVPAYLAEVHTPPEQLTTGLCNKENNKYIYKKVSKNFYEITFCSGEIGGYQAGVHKASADGIR